MSFGDGLFLPDATVPGLVIVDDFVSPLEETHLLGAIDAMPWLSDLSRQVQHYGYTYDYRARRVTRDRWLGPLPPWLAARSSKGS